MRRYDLFGKRYPGRRSRGGTRKRLAIRRLYRASYRRHRRIAQDWEMALRVPSPEWDDTALQNMRIR